MFLPFFVLSPSVHLEKIFQEKDDDVSLILQTQKHIQNHLITFNTPKSPTFPLS